MNAATASPLGPAELLRFTPRLLRDWLARAGDGEPGPAERSLEAVVLIADIVGYSRLMRRAADAGLSGVEAVAQQVRDLFSGIELVFAQAGADIIGFAGDAMLVAWPAHRAHGRVLEQALAVAARIHAAGVLQMRIGCAQGQLHLLVAGGVGGHWRFLAVGPAVARAGDALKGCAPGATRVARIPASPEEALPYAQQEPTPRTMEDAEPDAELDAAQAHRLRAFVPPFVAQALAGPDPGGIAEFRFVRTLFLVLRGEIDNAEAMGRVGAAVRLLQSVAERSQAALARVAADEKGLCVLMVWGTPGHQHEDDAARCLKAAAEATAGLDGIGGAWGGGLAAGRAYAGLAGGRSRCEYTVTGPAVNVAARLMAAANEHVLCDAISCDPAANGRFGPPQEVTLDAAERLTTTARALLGMLEHAAADELNRHNATPMFGRQAELGRALGWLADPGAAAPAVLLIDAEAGAGKTLLLHKLCAAAARDGRRCIVAACLALQSDTAYHAAGQWLRGLAPPEHATSAERLGGWLLSRLAEAGPGGPDAAPLGALAGVLNDVLPLGLPETADSRRLSEQGRAEVAQRLFARLLGRSATLLAIDDAQWLDSASASLARSLLQRLPACRLLLARRSGHAGPAGLVDEPAPRHLVLAPLGRPAIEQLVRARLGCASVHAALIDCLHGATSGHPLFATALLQRLRADDAIQVEDGLARLRPGWSDEQRRAAVAPGIEALVLRQLDQMPAPSRQVLRVASVFGPVIPRGWLARLPELGTAPGVLDEALALGRVRGLLRLEGECEVFSHGLVQETIYDSLAFAERRRLHGLVARLLEHERDAEAHGDAPLLARHWLRSDDHASARRWALLAGEQALRRFANREAAGFFESALALPEAAAPEAVGEGWRARAERLLGYAAFGLGDLARSRAHLESSLRAAGRGVPAGKPRLLLGALGHGAARLARLPQPRAIELLAAADKPYDSEAFALMRLLHIAYFECEPERFLYAGLRGAAAADRSGSPHDRARMYLGLAAICTGARLHRAAARFAGAGIEAAARLASPALEVQVRLLAAVHEAGLARWPSCTAHLRVALQGCQAMGDRRQAEEAMITAFMVHQRAGQVGQATELLAVCLEQCRERGDAQTLGWASLAAAQQELLRGRALGALQHLRRARGIVVDRLSTINLEGHCARAAAELGDTEQALAAARAALHDLDRPPLSFSVVEGLADLTRALLRLRQLSRAGAARLRDAEIEAHLRQALRRLRAFCRMFPIGEPTLLLAQAEAQLQDGRRGQALNGLRKAGALAAQLAMPLDEWVASQGLLDHGEPAEQARAARRVAELRAEVGPVEPWRLGR